MTGTSYAEALYSLAVEEGITDEIYEQISSVRHAFIDNPDLSKILDRPCSDEKSRFLLIDRCFGKFNRHLVNCIKIMSKKRVTLSVPDMADGFMKLYREDNGIEIVNVVTAVPLGKEQTEKLKNKIESIIGKKVILSQSINADILGGVIVRTESFQMDSSIKTKLEDIGKQIRSAVI